MNGEEVLEKVLNLATDNSRLYVLTARLDKQLDENIAKFDKMNAGFWYMYTEVQKIYLAEKDRGMDSVKLGNILDVANKYK